MKSGTERYRAIRDFGDNTIGPIGHGISSFDARHHHHNLHEHVEHEIKQREAASDEAKADEAKAGGDTVTGTEKQKQQHHLVMPQVCLSSTTTSTTTSSCRRYAPRTRIPSD